MKTALPPDQAYYHVIHNEVWTKVFQEDPEQALPIRTFDEDKGKRKDGRFMPRRGSKHFAEDQETALHEASWRFEQEMRATLMSITPDKLLKRTKAKTTTIRTNFSHDLQVVCLERVDDKAKCRDEFMGVTGMDPLECLRPGEYENSCDAAEALDVDAQRQGKTLAGIRWQSVKRPGGYCLSVFEPDKMSRGADTV